MGDPEQYCGYSKVGWYQTSNALCTVEVSVWDMEQDLAAVDEVRVGEEPHVTLYCPACLLATERSR